MFLTLGCSIKLKPPDFQAAMKRPKNVNTNVKLKNYYLRKDYQKYSYASNYEYEDNEQNMQIKTT